MKHCKNCGAKTEGSYCSHCGQKTKLERITFSYIWHGFFHFFTHLEKGFLFTSFQMLRSPGKSTKEFIEGKRIIHQSPVSYFLIWITAYILLLYFYEKVMGQNTVINYRQYFGPSSATHFAISNLSMVLIAVVPFQALWLFALITYRVFTYFETMIIAIYAIGTIILLQFVFALIALPVSAVTGTAVDLQLSDLLKALYISWLAFDLVKLFDLKLKWLRAIGFLILAAATFTIWRLYGVPAIYHWIFSGM